MRTTWILLLAVVAGAVPRLAAGDPPASPETKKRAESLRVRASQWCDLRKTVVYKCASCEGLGRTSSVVNEGGILKRVPKDCPACVRGAKVDLVKAKAAYFDTGTPEWRQSKEHVDATQVWIDSLPKNPVLVLLKKAVIESVEIVGTRHGITKIRETHETELIAPVEYKWVLVEDPKAKTSTWCLWHESDGAWGLEAGAVEPEKPADPAAPAAPGKPADPARPSSTPKPADPSKPAPPPVGVPLADDARESLAKALAVADVKPALDGAEMLGDVLVLRLLPKGARDQPTLDEQIARAIIPASRVAMRDCEKAATVRLDFLARYRDRFGEVAPHPYETVTIARDVFSRIRFENLTREEALDLFGREPHVYRLEGFTLWWKE